VWRSGKKSRSCSLPPARMKAAREHRVPLSARALAILENVGDAKTSDYVFPSPRGRKPLSHVSMAKVMHRLRIDGTTVHGFRSAFRDWCGEVTSFPRELAEAALAHVAGDATERAYRRGDALEKRRALMAAWANHCESKPCSNVVPLSKRGA
jgi:integrase